MSNHSPLTYGNTTYRARRAIIESTRFGESDHGGVTDFTLRLSYPDGGAGMSSFGGYALDAAAKSGRTATAYGMDVLQRVMGAAGVTGWEDVAGSECLALFAENPEDPENFWGTHPAGIATAVGTNVLDLEVHAAQWRERETRAAEAAASVEETLAAHVFEHNTDGNGFCTPRLDWYACSCTAVTYASWSQDDDELPDQPALHDFLGDRRVYEAAHRKHLADMLAPQLAAAWEADPATPNPYLTAATEPTEEKKYTA